MQEVSIGFLGCGNIGCGVWRLLADMAPEFAAHEGKHFTVRRILVHDVSKKRPVELPAQVLTTRPEDVLEDPQIEVILEFLGGEQPAADYMLRALCAGKTVVTANKMALAMHWNVLHQTAKQNGVGLYYEASVCGAIPILRTLNESLQANRIDQLFGIINGTTNYILTRMSRDGAAYRDILFDAQRLGLAEPDPTADVEGLDAAYKLSILSTLAFRAWVPLQNVMRSGITAITPEDIVWGREMGYALKLLAVAKRLNGAVQARVYPTFIPLTHPLSSVSDAFNAVYLHGHACGDMMLYGRGAGDLPTASALVSDLIVATCRPQVISSMEYVQDEILPCDMDWESRYFIRMSVVDQPGVLGMITSIMGRYGVSIASMHQADGEGRVPLLVVTHKTHEKILRKALAEVESTKAHVENVIYVEDMREE